MSIISVILILLLIGVILWAINKWAPVDPGMKKAINVIAMILIIIWILSLVGVLPIGDAKIPKVR